MKSITSRMGLINRIARIFLIIFLITTVVMIVLLLVGGFLGILTVSLPVTVLWCFWVGSLGTYLILFAFVKTIQPDEVKSKEK